MWLARAAIRSGCACTAPTAGRSPATGRSRPAATWHSSARSTAPATSRSRRGRPTASRSGFAERASLRRRLIVRRLDLVRLAVLRRRAIALLLLGERVELGVPAVLSVLGLLDQLGLGL